MVFLSIPFRFMVNLTILILGRGPLILSSQQERNGDRKHEQQTGWAEPASDTAPLATKSRTKAAAWMRHASQKVEVHMAES